MQTALYDKFNGLGGILEKEIAAPQILTRIPFANGLTTAAVFYYANALFAKDGGRCLRVKVVTGKLRLSRSIAIPRT